ncbi:MAG TPA: DUF5069 domain-containing protein [Candidatus Cybelea sp.]|jgi:hypothetical protein
MRNEGSGRPFRSPYEKALGLVFLPRLIDKMRAVGTPTLDGYNYKTVGMDATVLGFLEVDGDVLEAYVREGHNDDRVYAWIQAHGRHYDAADAQDLNHRILDRGQRSDDEKATFEARRAQRYPGREDLRYYVDLIEADEGGAIRARPLPKSAYEPE